MVRTTQGSPATRRAACFKRVIQTVLVRPLALLASVALITTAIAGGGDPINGMVRFVLETGSQIRNTGVDGQYALSGCVDTRHSTVPTSGPSLACRHYGERQVTLASVTADVRFLAVLAYILSVVAAWFVADHLTSLRGLFGLLQKRMHRTNTHALPSGETDVDRA